MEVWLSRVSSSRFSLELVIYCICLHVYTMSSVMDQLAAIPADLYQASPTQLISHVITAVKSHDLQASWSERQKPWIDLLLKYQQMLSDHAQAEILLDLGLG